MFYRISARALATAFGVVACVVVFSSVAANAQTVQLPTIETFTVNTAVMVPDGGTAHLGGISRSAYGRNSRGIPGLSQLPYAGRLFRNQGIGYDQSVGNASVNVRLILLKEMEDELMADYRAELANRPKPRYSINASVRRKADFISKNVGRGSKR
jgi:hypothetical protein